MLALCPVLALKYSMHVAQLATSLMHRRSTLRMVLAVSYVRPSTLYVLGLKVWVNICIG